MIADGAAAKEAARLEGGEQQRLADEEFKRLTAERVQLYLAGGRNAPGPARANAAQDLPEAPPHCASHMSATM